MPLPAILTLIYSVAVHSLVILASVFGDAAVHLHFSERDFLWIFVGVSGVASVFESLVRSRRATRVALVVHGGAFLALQSLMVARPALWGPLGLSMLLAVALYERHPVNLVASVVVLALVAVASTRYAVGTFGRTIGALIEQVTTVVAMATAAIAVCAAARYREELVTVQERYRRLDVSIGQLTRLNQEYQDSLVRAESESTEKERRRITRDIHDVVGYTLTNNIMLMEAAMDMARINPLGVTRMLTTARENAQEGLQRMRQILYALRRESTQAPHGTTALAKLISTFETATGIAVKVHYTNLRSKLPYKVDLTLYHIVQEGLVNAFRHGESTRVDVTLSECDGSVQVVLSDNGIGTDGVVSGIGLQGMLERVTALEGSLTWHSSSYGFTVNAIIPFLRKDDGKDDPAPAG